MIGGIGLAVTVLVLVALVALAAASFFTNMLTAVLLSLGIPVVVLLHALVGTLSQARRDTARPHSDRSRIAA